MIKLLVAIDGSAASERIAQYITRWRAAGPAAEFHLINVQIPAVSGLGRSFVSQPDLDAYYREEADRALAPAQRVLDGAGLPHSDHLLVGHPASAIADFAAEHGFDGIIIGTHGRTALGRLLLGSVASEVIERATVPVTLVK